MIQIIFGIALVNTMYNIFSSILNKRLYSWVEDKKTLDELQAGFLTIYFPEVLLYKNIYQDVGAILLFVC